MNDAALRAALATVIDPEIRKPVTELDMIKSAVVDGSTARVELQLTIVACPAADRIERDVRKAALSTPGIEAADIAVSVMAPETRRALIERLRGQKRNPFGPDSLTHIVAITSGKGGVGKSTVTANVAVALAAEGLSVGLIDADVHGYSIPGILGIDASPTRVGDLMMPPEKHGVRVLSIGMLVEGNQAVSWRGPMLHRTLSQFLTDAWWGDLDVLVIDMPPGTGDVAISLGQLLPNADVVVVTTPQRSAADVAERSAGVARQTGQRVIGVVETMSAGADASGAPLDIFGSGGGDEVAARLDVPLLATIPLSIELRQAGDDGEPIVLRDPADPAATALASLAKRIRTSRPRGGAALPFTRA